MNTQTELTQIDTEISELQAKLVKTQERRELLASVKPACDTVLEAVDKALDILRLVALSNDFGLAEIATFKAAIDTKFKFMEEQRATQTEQRAIKSEVETLQTAKTESNRSSEIAKIFADTHFPDRPVQHKQLQVIILELEAIGIVVGEVIATRHSAKGWHLRWGQDKAGLFWTAGQGWGIEAAKYGDELTGQWEGFDLDQHLECNGIDLEDYFA